MFQDPQDRFGWVELIVRLWITSLMFGGAGIFYHWSASEPVIRGRPRIRLPVALALMFICGSLELEVWHLVFGNPAAPVLDAALAGGVPWLLMFSFVYLIRARLRLSTLPLYGLIIWVVSTPLYIGAAYISFSIHRSRQESLPGLPPQLADWLPPVAYPVFYVELLSAAIFMAISYVFVTACTPAVGTLPPSRDASDLVPGPKFPESHRRTRRKIAGPAWKTLGICLIVLVLLGATLDSGPARTVVWLTGLEVLYLAKICYIRGKKLATKSAIELLATDARSPVLYLRSFCHDKEAARTPRQRGDLFSTTTEEERIARVMNDIGPFVCVGRPGERLSELGAARMYVSNDQWRDAVSGLMDHARLVVLRIGRSDGLLWELEQLTNRDPRKLLLLVTRRRKEYQAFREGTKAYFPHPLPEYGGGQPGSMFRSGGLGKLRGLIYFDENWGPNYIKLTALKWPWRFTPRFLGGSNLIKRLRWGLRPVFNQIGLEWKAPHIRWLLLMACVVLLLMTLVAVEVILKTVLFA